MGAGTAWKCPNGDCRSPQDPRYVEEVILLILFPQSSPKVSPAQSPPRSPARGYYLRKGYDEHADRFKIAHCIPEALGKLRGEPYRCSQNRVSSSQMECVDTQCFLSPQQPLCYIPAELDQFPAFFRGAGKGVPDTQHDRRCPFHPPPTYSLEIYRHV